MNYLYSHIQNAEFELNTPQRIAFKQHLNLVAEACKAVELVDSGDNSEGSENEFISACLFNKKQLIDFIGKANDQLVLQDIVKQFCKSINLDIEISYKYAIYVYVVKRHNTTEQNHLYTKKNNVVLFDTFDKAHRACSLFDTDDTWAEIEVYQRIIKYDDTTIVYDIYER